MIRRAATSARVSAHPTERRSLAAPRVREGIAVRTARTDRIVITVASASLELLKCLRHIGSTVAARQFAPSRLIPFAAVTQVHRRHQWRASDLHSASRRTTHAQQLPLAVRLRRSTFFQPLAFLFSQLACWFCSFASRLPFLVLSTLAGVLVLCLARTNDTCSGSSDVRSRYAGCSLQRVAERFARHRVPGSAHLLLLRQPFPSCSDDVAAQP